MRRRGIIAAAACAAALSALVAGAAMAQTAEEGPWWPHPIWGPGDQAGASNWITPAKVLDAVALVKTGKIYEMGQVYERGMPLFGERTYALLIPGSPASPESWGKNRLVGNDEFLCAEIGQVGTQFDGLAHVGTRMTMADGSEQNVYYNGFTGDQIRGRYGMAALGIEQIKPIVTRGILVDIAAYKGVEMLPNGYEVTVEDVLGALKRNGLSEDDLKDGDAYFFRFGWSKLWEKPDEYNTNPPGIGLEVARWVVAQNATMIGSDSWGSELFPNPDPELLFPVHQELMTKNGIFNLENLKLEELSAEGVHEFLFVFTPVPFKGATGSPGRPIAIR
jgi:kynurenine formamidase